MDCMATAREAPPQLRQAAYATQPADAAGPNAQMITMPPGVYIVYATRGVYFLTLPESDTE